MPTASRPPVVILCGGRGTRLQEHTREIPKPLVEIGGLPILWHVIRLYAAQGFTRFLLATGYRGELIESFVASHAWPEGVGVSCVDTGLDTPTGGRVKLIEPHLEGERFCLTYADGLADIDLAGLLDFHSAHGALVTMTVVRPRLQFGVTELDGEDGRVLGFHEKPRSEHWINGGFFCVEAPALDYLTPESVLEREPLERLAAEGELHAYRHGGFWECMDTYKDAVALNDLWAAGQDPWRLWAGEGAIRRTGGRRGEGELSLRAPGRGRGSRAR
ncbi:MAG TPA: sugar phosphate nucleotidyltransferase [Solirubrobacteraceae bacterium]|jgi:glucose-1-phosphate cytidylyltransferase|nr:sugar phosphate nucleotidyltransferase [Solirubrobacteraceae bacterium]